MRSKDSDTVLVCRPTTLGVGKHSERGYGRTLSASKIRPSNAVSGNTVCTFPSCRGSWRHRWLILVKWITPPKRKNSLRQANFTVLPMLLPGRQVRRTYGSFTSDAGKNDWRWNLGFGHRTRRCNDGWCGL